MTQLEQVARFVWMIDVCELKGWLHLAEFVRGLLNQLLQQMETEAR